ncbi:DUF2160 domain-containing protein [Stagnihabitans tardus]|uniref:Glycerol-3-phosphate ABC transporter n=1 Tax=Stagnihabitans tardus TaxID=2699202 RepID=A0AAE5BXJ2_9RHOB|nr:DUF2160 domain-containing protein [Stagnihabitans tardus]NBZ89403.1 glycerol-3-phosphate ABC transporter [Stagnihabitans tardus]
MPASRWTALYALTIGVMVLILAWFASLVPIEDGQRDWTGQLVEGGWMAWSFPVALFFWLIAATLLTFTFLALRFPETPRRGVLGIRTTRGDRLFITLLGAAFLNIAWLGFSGQPQWQGLLPSLIWAIGVFRFV